MACTNEIQSCDIIKLLTLLDCLERYILKHPVVPIWNNTLTWKLTSLTKAKSSTLTLCLRTAWRLGFSFSPWRNAKHFTKIKPRYNTVQTKTITSFQTCRGSDRKRSFNNGDGLAVTVSVTAQQSVLHHCTRNQPFCLHSRIYAPLTRSAKIPGASSPRRPASVQRLISVGPRVRNFMSAFWNTEKCWGATQIFGKFVHPCIWCCHKCGIQIKSHQSTNCR